MHFSTIIINHILADVNLMPLVQLVVAHLVFFFTFIRGEQK